MNQDDEAEACQGNQYDIYKGMNKSWPVRYRSEVVHEETHENEDGLKVQRLEDKERHPRRL